VSLLRQDPHKLGAAIAVGLLLVGLPFYASEYTVTTFVSVIYYGFLALSVGMLIGQGGMVSLTQTAFYGFAGYSIGLLGYERGLAFPLPDVLAICIVVLLALAFGLIAMRTHQLTFLMLTLALGQVSWAFAAQNTTLLHGWAGIRGIRPMTVFGIDFTDNANFYWGALALFTLALLLLWRIVHSPFGLALNGTRESPRRMAALGYPVYQIRVAAFVIAAVYAGVGGILGTYYAGIVTPTTMQLGQAIWVLLMVILGGATYFWGPVVGTVIAVSLRVLVSSATDRYNLVIGVIFVLVILFSPTGVLGLLDSIRKRRRTAGARPRNSLVAADAEQVEL